MAGALYLDTSAILRATLEAGTSRETERRIEAADDLITSRLSLVESARAILRVRRNADLAEGRLSDVERQIERILHRCDFWELTAEVCEMASRVAPQKDLRTLDALHLATFVLARRRIEGLELLTADLRLRDAASAS